MERDLPNRPVSSLPPSGPRVARMSAMQSSEGFGAKGYDLEFGHLRGQGGCNDANAPSKRNGDKRRVDIRPEDTIMRTVDIDVR